MSKVTFAVIAYHQDFTLLDRLLHSVEMYCDINQIDSIKIVLNDPLVYLDNLNAILKKYLNLKIELILAHTLEPRINNGFGWNSQQLFKCLLSEHITTDWYIIHDCKDYYTQPVDLIKDAFTSDGKALMRIHQNGDFKGLQNDGGLAPFNLAHDIACNVWGVDNQDTVQWHLPTTTPFFVKTEMMQGMVNELRDMVRGFLPYLFNLSMNDQRFATEFLMYNAYCTARNNLDNYMDWSYNSDYYKKIGQSKDLRLNFPPNPQPNQKCFLNGTVYEWDGNIWRLHE